MGNEIVTINDVLHATIVNPTTTETSGKWSEGKHRNYDKERAGKMPLTACCDGSNCYFQPFINCLLEYNYSSF